MAGLAAMCCGPIVGSTLAQDGGPIILGEQERLEWFNIEDYGLALDGQGRLHRSRVELPGGPDALEEEQIYRGAIELWGDAYIGHPNLVDLDLMGRFGISDEDVQSDIESLSEHTSEALTEYDVSALFLRQSNLPLTLYSNRFDTIIDRQFGESIESLNTETGARLQLRSPTFPSTFHVFHREEDQESQLGTSEFDLVQDTFEWQSQFRPGPNQELTWDYTFDDVQQSNFGGQTTFQRHNGLATHVLDFGAENEHSLRSTVNLFRESGDFSLDRLRWNEMLRLRHTRRFETYYDTVLDLQRRPDGDQLFTQGIVGMRHRLFESLITSADVGASLLELSPDDFTSHQLFGDLDFDYTKRVPYGRLAAGLAVHVNRQEDSERGSTIRITDERRAFPSSGLIILNRRNIIAESIVLTDAAGIVTFTEGFDYTVRAFSERVEIRRVLGGAIPDGAIVLIDYDVAPEPANTTDTIGTGVTVRYDFDEGWLRGMGIFARYFIQEQERTSDSPGLLPADDIQSVAYGADYRLGHMFFSAEQRVHDSTVSPYNADRLEARYEQPLGLGDSLLLSATYDKVDRTDDDLLTAITNVTARWNSRVTERLEARAAFLYREEREDPGFDVQAFEQEIRLSWRHRQTSIFGSFRNVIQNSEAGDSMFQTIHFGVRREF